MTLWNKLMNSVGDFLWFTCFLLVGAGLAALFFLTYFIPKRDSLRELVRTQQGDLLKAKIAFFKARRDRLIDDQKSKPKEPDVDGAEGGNKLLKDD